jgi:signal transduction histidine kinase
MRHGTVLSNKGRSTDKVRWRDGAGARVILPSLILLGLGLVALFWISRQVANDIDRQALDRETRVISTMIRTKAHHWGKLALDYAFWDDAYAHMSGEPDREWMQGNFDQAVPEAQGANALLLIREDLTVDAWFGDARDDRLVAGAEGLSDLVRAVLAKRGKGPHSADGAILWDGSVALAGISRLMPQNSQFDPSKPPKLVLFVAALKPSVIAEWSQNLEIKDMALGARPVQGSPHYDLKTRRGDVLAAISWSSDMPGTKFMQAQVVLRTGIMLSLMMAFALLVLGWAGIVRKLHATAAKAEAEAESSRSKSAFLANMSHELRTPLNAIIGFSEMMKDEVFGPVGRPQYKDYASHVYGSGKHLLQIINSLLDVAKFQAGQFEQKLEPVTLGELARAVSAAHARTLEGAGLNFAVEGAGATIVMADTRSMARIIEAILSNAAKFTPRGGSVDVILRDGPRPAIIVRDTGCGIPPDKLEAMGRPFEQAADVLKRDHGGVGLGLAFARMLAEGMGGKLTLESAEGEGTTVTVELAPAPAKLARAA